VPAALPRILFFNINGSGLGHMSTCLAYARRLGEHARAVFLSLAPAIEIIQDMGFEADYLVSPVWSRAKPWDWDQQLAWRLGMMLERFRPDVIVFDGTWPFHGLLEAVKAYGTPKLVWSNLSLYKPRIGTVLVSESHFDLVIRLGELGSGYTVEREERPARKVTIPPVMLLRDEELLSRDAARAELRLESNGRYALVSLGAGNLNDITAIARGLIEELCARGFIVVWARPPISLREVPLPAEVVPISVYPLARYMRGFDAFIGAAGYNTCCELMQAGVPSLLVPNDAAADDQWSRARMAAKHGRVVVSRCETSDDRAQAVQRLMRLIAHQRPSALISLDGAAHAATELLALLNPEKAHAVRGNESSVLAS
jgi:UDP-N-acetylglucosamine--N-acetylmuramyl-(pentapeptide) pyrophosphoryl-undecaprenol N-acetylglucosamine transferase